MFVHVSSHARPQAWCGGAFSLLAILAVGGCASQTQLGGGSSMATGSAGVAGTQSASGQLARCDRPLGTAALVEPGSAPR